MQSAQFLVQTDATTYPRLLPLLSAALRSPTVQFGFKFWLGISIVNTISIVVLWKVRGRGGCALVV